jgi:hypothetical protein
LHISAVKRSEDEKGWVICIFNPSNKPRIGQLRLNGGFSGPMRIQPPVERAQAEFALPPGKGNPWRKVQLVILEETPARELAMDGEGWVRFEIGEKKILTMEFLP